MAVYTPANLVGPAANLTTGVTAYNASSSTVGVIRTISACANTTAQTVSVSLGADAAATRIIASFALTANVPQVWNGWWVTASNTAHAIDMTAPSNAAGTTVVGSINGYSYG